MRQGLLVIAFVAYSLLAVAQAPMPEVKPVVPLNDHQLMSIEMDKIMADLKKTGISGLFLPLLPVLKEQYKAHYNEDLPAHLEAFYPTYMGIRNPYVNGSMGSMGGLGWPAPPTTTSKFLSGNLGFIRGMAEHGMGGLIPELANIMCARERSARCLQPFEGGKQIAEKEFKDSWEAQNKCLMGVADEIQGIPDTQENVSGSDVLNAECANLIRTDVRNFRKAIEEGKYGFAVPTKTQPASNTSGRTRGGV